MLEVHRWRQIDWAPSAVVALATSVDGTVVAAARENGSIELWNVAPGSVGWHCHLTIPGKEEAAISSLVWCKSGGDQSTPLGRLFSAGLDGFITEWNLQTLQPKEIVESYGGSVWQLAAEPLEALKNAASSSNGALLKKNSDGSDSDESSSSDSDSEDEEEEGSADKDVVEQRIAVGCDDGCVRIFTVGDNQAGMLYRRAFPRVKGRILSVAWSTDATRVYAGGSDGCIRCWDSKNIRELFRITAGIGGRGTVSELCVWSLLALRNGTIVSGDSTGSTQFWEGEHGTLLQGHSKHNADVLALAAAPSHNVVFAAGADGQVTLYQLVDESKKDANGSHPSSEKNIPRVRDRWVYVGNKRNHTHDVKALALAYPVVQEEGQAERPVQKRRRRSRNQSKNDYKKWAQPGIPMLISGGNDCKLFTYPAEAFLAFHPHDICHAPQRPHVQFAGDLSSSGLSVLMAQHSTWIDVWKMNTNRNAVADMELGYEFGKEVLGKRKFRDEASYVVGNPIKMNGSAEKKTSIYPVSNGKTSPYPSKQVASTKGVAPALIARIKCKTVEHIACSAISGNGKYVAFSDRLKPRLFELEQQQVGASNSSKAKGIIAKKKLSTSLPAAQCMLFTPDSTRLLLGSTQQIMVLNVENGEVLHSFEVAPPRSARGVKGSLSPINFMCTSADSQWLAATTSSGYIHIFSLEALRHHWSVPVMDGTVATSAIFRPSSSNVLIISTAGNQLHVLDVEAKELTKWSTANGEVLSMRLLEFPGGITGLSYSWSTSVPVREGIWLIPETRSTVQNRCTVEDNIHSYRAMVQVDFSKPVKLHSHEPKEKSHAHANGNGVAPKQNGNSYVHNDNFAYVPFKDPVIFLGHTAQSSVLVVEKPWLEVLRQIPAPVYRHLYGT